MYGLICDSATSYLYLALYKDGSILKEELVYSKSDTASILFPTLDLVLGDVKLNEIEEVICGIGPGSFTGVRICLTFAKMLAFSNVKLRVISSLRLMSSFYKGNVLSYLDARNGNVFYSLYPNLCESKFGVFEELKETYKDYQLITDKDFKVSLDVCLKESKEVSDFNLLEPNYVRNGKHTI